LPSAFCGIFTETKGDAPVLIVSVPSRFGFDWLNLDETAGTDEFTVIFSSVALSHPDFLSSPALHELTSDEQKQLNDFLSQSKPNLLCTETVKSGASPFVSVKIPQNAEGNASVVFKIRIEHK